MPLPLGIVSISFLTEGFEKLWGYLTVVQHQLGNLRMKKKKARCGKLFLCTSSSDARIACCICMHCSSDFGYFPMLGSCTHLSPPLLPKHQGLPGRQLRRSFFCVTGKHLNANIVVLLCLCAFPRPLRVNSEEVPYTSSSIHSSAVFRLGPHTAWQLYLQGVL